MTIYLYLIHGRKDPQEDMQDWGFRGPTLGPFAAIHVTYLSSLRCFKDDGSELEIKFHEDMIEHGGCFYGDFEITSDRPASCLRRQEEEGN